eukprot:363564-Chlamydomonas_euryale.AAC.18
MKSNISQDNSEPRGGGEENVGPCEMTPMIRDQRRASDHPLHRTARGRDAHGHDAALGWAILAQRGEGTLQMHARAGDFNTFSHAWSVPRGVHAAEHNMQGEND